MPARAKALSSALALLMVVLSGCALTTARVNLAYRADSERKGPLSTIKPMTVALHVDDKRAPGERDRVGDKKNAFGAVMARVTANKDVTSVLYDALKSEFENNGHKVVATGNADSDVVISANLTKCWVDTRIHAFDLEMIGTAGAEMTVRNRDGTVVYGTKPVIGTFQESRAVATAGAYEHALNGALAELVRNVARDPSVLEALRRAQQEREKEKI